MTVIGTSEIDVRARTTGFTNDVERGVGGKVSSLAGSIQGKLLGALGVGAVVKAIGTIGIAYQDSLNTFSAVADKAQLQAAGGLDAVGDAAIKLGNDLQLPNTSAADAAGAMTELAKAGLSVKDTMNAAKGTLQLATAASIDEAQAATITANALNTFHLAGTKAADVANVLANAANVSSGEVTDFAMGLAQGGLAAKNAGLDISETAGALALFANNGLRGSDAGTSLKTMLSRLVPTSNTAKRAMDDLGLSFVDAHGNFLPLDQIAQQLKDHMGGLTQAERAHQMQVIFGSDAVRAATLLYGAGAKGVDHYTNAVDKAGGVQAIAAAKAKGLGGALRGFQSQAETLALTVFNDVAPSLEELVKDASSLMPTVTTLAHVAGEVLAPAFGLVGDALSTVGHIVGTVTSTLEDHKGVAVALAIVIGASLVPALVRAAIAAGTRAFEMLAVGMYRATISAGVLAKSFNPVVAAATIAAVGIGLMFERDARLARAGKQAADDYVQSLNVIPTSLDSINSALDKFRGGTAIEDALGDPDVVKGGATAAIAAFKELGAQYEQLQQKATAVRSNERALQDQFGLTQAQVESLARTNDIDLSASLSTVTDRMRGAIEANKQSHHPLQQARADVADLGAESNSAADDVKALTAALDLLAGDALSADQAAIAFRNDIDALDKALKKSHGSMVLSNKAARDARDAFDSAAQQAISAAEAQAKLKGGTDRARATLQDEIGTLREHAGNSDYAKAALNRLRAALDEIPGAANDAANGLHHVSGQSHKEGQQAGQNYGTGFIGGINSMFGNMVTAVEDFVGAAAAAAKHKQKSGSPSRVTFGVGQEWGQGYVLGIEDLVPSAIIAATNMAASMSGALELGLSRADVRGAVRRSLRTDIESAEHERDAAVAQLGRARTHRGAARDDLAEQADIYKPLRASANAAAREVNRLQQAIDKEVHSAHPNEKRIRALRREQDEARKTAEQTDKLADHAQKAYDRANERADKWADRTEEAHKRVRDSQRALADAFRAEQVTQASAVLDTLSAEVDALVAKADGLKDAFASAVEQGTSLSAVLQSITDTVDGVTLQTGDPVAAYIGTLTTTLADSTALATDIGTLVGMGLNDSTVAEIIKLGPAAGDAFAQGLIAAGPEAIATINTLVEGIGDVAEHGMDAVAEQLYGPGARVLGSLIDGIRSEFPELDATIDEINAKLATIGAGNAAVAAAGGATSTTAAATTTKLASIDARTTITVQGDVSDKSIARLQTWADNHDAELVRLAQTGVK